ncbi:MAG: adenylate kinase [Ignavibacteriales bacterium]|nr:MAG: adenylate kinase [Ignavibacteriales bacterium]
MRIVMFGAPGVGKGTQAKILADKLNVPHISTGDILRSAIKNQTVLGLKAKEIVESGYLVPDDLMADLIKEVLSGKECEKGFILDGYPRTLDQAKLLDEIFQSLKTDEEYYLAITVDDELIIQRLSNRLACKVCGTIFTLSEVEGKTTCPKCGAAESLYKRKDDEEDVIRNRLNVFHAQTEPVLDYYKSKGKLTFVNGDQPVNMVAEELVGKIK